MFCFLAMASCLAFTTPAAAKPASRVQLQTSAQIERGLAIARTVWHHPCVDRATVSWGRAPAGLPARAGAWAYLETCSIVFEPRALSWSEFCTRLIHEAGHLANYRDPSNVADPLHSHDPRSVMFYVSWGISEGRDQLTGLQVKRSWAAPPRCGV